MVHRLRVWKKGVSRVMEKYNFNFLLHDKSFHAYSLIFYSLKKTAGMEYYDLYVKYSADRVFN